MNKTGKRSLTILLPAGAVIFAYCLYPTASDFIDSHVNLTSILFISVILLLIYVTKRLISSIRHIDELYDVIKSHDNQQQHAPSSEQSVVTTLTNEHQELLDRSEFIVNVSHELCAPLHAMIGYADLLSRTDLTEKQNSYVSSIIHSGQLMSDLAQEITTFASLEGKEISIKNQVFKIGSVLEDVMDILGNRASIQKLELICEYNELLESECISDPVRIRQLLINLVSNSIKYTQNGYILIRTNVLNEDNNAYLYFEVIDTGIGISKEDQEKIFSPFCQLSRHFETASGERGAGLGLTINSRLVEAMRGSMGVSSEKGKGSTFWIKVPCKLFATTRTDAVASHAFLRNRSALVIEDNCICGNSLVSTLEFFGVKTQVATTTDMANGLLQESINAEMHYDFIVMSSRIDEDSSLNLAMQIREIPEYHSTPMIITVPISEPLAVGLVSRIQPALCINKPIIPSKFKNALSRVTRLLENRNTDELMLGTSDILSSSAYLDKKILVADDNPVSRNLLLEMLREIRFFANGVADGQTALDLLYTPSPHRYDVVILDCQIPGMDGYEIAERIRTLNLEKQPVIIMTSSDNTVNNQLKCYKAGADDFLEKPIMHDNLISTLLSWLPSEMRARLHESMNSQTVVNIFNAPVLDDGIIKLLRDHANGKGDFINNLYALFINDTSERLDGIMRHIKQRNYDEIIRASHAIKSGCMQFGARRMTRYCDVLGNMAKNQDIDEIENSLNLLIHEYNRVMSEFETYQALADEIRE